MNHRTVLAAVLLLSTACYHAAIETGTAPSGQVIEKEWAASWIDGLVPPDVIESTGKCLSGVSKVETQHSFLNMLVGVVTAGIYTPMSITVSCGTGRPDSLPMVHGTSDVARSLMQAAELSLASSSPVMLEFAQ